MTDNQKFILELLKLTVPSVVAIVVLIVGYFFTRASDRRNWLNDSRKSEYRELMSGLARAFDSMAKRNLINNGRLVPTAGRMQQLDEDMDACSRLFNDRLFIAEEIWKINLSQRWEDSVKYFIEHGDMRDLMQSFTAIRKDVVTLAQKHK